MRIRSAGLLSTIVCVPSPTLSLPDHENFAPSPDDGPSKTDVACGSSFAHGDHASQLWKSLTTSNTLAGIADIAADRVIRNSPGCRATTIKNTTIRAPSAPAAIPRFFFHF